LRSFSRATFNRLDKFRNHLLHLKLILMIGSGETIDEKRRLERGVLAKNDNESCGQLANHD